MTLKGRVAATIQSSDELVLTELIFNSGFKARLLLCHSGNMPLMPCHRGPAAASYWVWPHSLNCLPRTLRVQ